MWQIRGLVWQAPEKMGAQAECWGGAMHFRHGQVGSTVYISIDIGGQPEAKAKIIKRKRVTKLLEIPPENRPENRRFSKVGGRSCRRSSEETGRANG